MDQKALCNISPRGQENVRQTVARRLAGRMAFSKALHPAHPATG